MRAPIPTALTILAVVVAIAAPIVLALQLSSLQAAAAARDHALLYARRVIERTDSIAAQIGEVTTTLGVNRPDYPCESDYRDRMKAFAVESIYVQAIGFVVGNRLMCSSIGNHGEGLPLGAPDIETPGGVRIRADVRLPMAPNVAFIGIENRSFVAIIHKEMPINVTTVEDDAGLTVYSWRDKRLLSTRGIVQPGWLMALPEDQYEATFERDGYTVAVVRSQRFGTPAAVAAIPQHYLDERALRFAAWFVPVGLLCGIALAFMVFHFARRQREMPAELRQALRRNEFFLAYQPVVELATGRWIGVEALIRWKRRGGDFVRPDIFIAVAEEAGIIGLITERVMQLVQKDAGGMLKLRKNFHIGINLASTDLESEDIAVRLRDLAIDMGGRPANLMVEATERGFLRADVARRTVRQIRGHGMGVAIDDFGTGYSSLSYLESFELDYLKIDKSFVDTIGTGAATSQVIPHIIEMAKSLKLAMIAEGVENEAQAQYLRERGVQYAQGWLFGKPVPPAEIVAKLAAS